MSENRFTDEQLKAIDDARSDALSKIEDMQDELSDLHNDVLYIEPGYSLGIQPAGNVELALHDVEAAIEKLERAMGGEQ